MVLFAQHALLDLQEIHAQLVQLDTLAQDVQPVQLDTIQIHLIALLAKSFVQLVFNVLIQQPVRLAQ